MIRDVFKVTLLVSGRFYAKISFFLFDALWHYPQIHLKSLGQRFEAIRSQLELEIKMEHPQNSKDIL